MTVLAIIPARGGSKRIPGKNIALCAGKPLLGWTAEAALQSALIDRTILSTDCQEIAKIGLEFGLDVPFLRPAHLASDQAAMPPVLHHLLTWAEAEISDLEALVLLQPTSPLRTAHHIDDAITLFREKNAGSVVSVVQPPHRFHPWKLLQLSEHGLEPFMDSTYRPAQEIPSFEPVVYGRNGPALIVSRPSDIRNGLLYGTPSVPYLMSQEHSLDIDEPLDFKLAEFLLRERQLHNNPPLSLVKRAL